MTSVGRRPTLHELLLALHAICRIEADADTLDHTKETFRVVLTFNRENCPNDWREGEPKPTWFIEQLMEELSAWLQQRTREEQWVSKEEQFGASIDTLQAYWLVELKKHAAIQPQNMPTRSLMQILSNTILRLKELKERRDAGGVYSATENRRDKARKAWMEDEYEAPKREEEQRRQQANRGRFYETHSGYTGFEGIDPDTIKKMWERMDQTFNFNDFSRKQPPPPQANNKRSWYAILGISAHASKREITKAYRKLAAQYHPDRYKGADAHAKMAEINTARDEGLGGV